MPRCVEALAAEPSDPVDAPELVFAGTYVASGSGWWPPMLAAPMLVFAAEETRTAVVRRRGGAAAGPIDLEGIGPSDS